ncbi:MAG: hypothetical protein IAE86_08605 [Burkholderiaceae bacterium]|nr:hypothetical protein [Burkholderiaceae bacterium]
MRSSSPPAAKAPPVGAATADAEALTHAVNALLAPIAQLAVAKGMPCSTVEALLRKAFVRAARDAHPNLAPQRMVSRIATATGLNRREVTRLTQHDAMPAPRRPLSAEVFARWSSDPHYRDAKGRPRKLARQGPAPSFEALAQSVTRDVHPRSLLDELLRLGLAAADAADDSVALVHDAFVPRGDAARMLGFLGDNVGDHLSGAVANVLGDGRRHFEQAVFADELSAQSLEATRATISAQWHALAAALVPQLEAAIAADRAAGRAQDQRLRIGLFSYSQRMPDDSGTTPDDAAIRTNEALPPIPTNERDRS